MIIGCIITLVGIVGLILAYVIPKIEPYPLEPPCPYRAPNALPQKLQDTQDPDLIAIWNLTELYEDDRFTLDELVELFGEEKIKEYKEIRWGIRDGDPIFLKDEYYNNNHIILCASGSYSVGLSHSETFKMAQKAIEEMRQMELTMHGDKVYTNEYINEHGDKVYTFNDITKQQRKKDFALLLNDVKLEEPNRTLHM